jgi:RNA polymerase sigma-70 factor (ECF subfamily)
VTGAAGQDLSVLAIAAADGDTAAFRRLLSAIMPRMLSVVRGLGVSPSEVEDVAQEASLALWKALDRYDADLPFEVWACVIAANKARDWRRRQAVRRFWSQAKTVEDAAGIADDAPGPENAAAAKQDLDRLWVALAALPDGLRTPLVLTVIAGLSQADAAAALGLSPKAVEARVARARAALARTMGAD